MSKQTINQSNGTVNSPKNYVLEAVPDEKTLAELSCYAIDYCHTIGNVALWNERKDSHDIAVTPPIALLPSPFPAELFEKAKAVQQTLSELYFRISLDHDFLIDAYRDVVKADKWIAKQIELMEKVKADGIRQPICVQLQRADYMSHWDEQEHKMELKNVEVNIGQVGGPGCATLMSKLHKKMIQKVENLRYGPLTSTVNGKLPENYPRKGMAETMFQAWKLFGDKDAVVVFMNQPELFPVCHFEQLQFIQFELEKLARKEGFLINVIRMPIKETAQRLCLNEKDYTMYADGKRVALIHMAYGYLPEHYPSDKEWQIRFDMERSKTILSPNIRLSLSGTKKIQQVLAKPGVIERFLPGQTEKIALLRSTFTGLWGLEEDNDNIRAIIKDAIEYPKKYVMKAQLGAGKGNYFDEQMADMLSRMSVKERGAYILQQKIWPVVAKNYMKRPFEKPTLENIVSEVGIYGSFIGNEQNGGKVLWNRVEGYLVRSKCHNVNQGGVSEGGGPGIPCNPFSPSFPCSPIFPGIPSIPGLPISPCSLCSPLGPLFPGIPLPPEFAFNPEKIMN
ncbi:Glutathione synthetase [Meloidogyne graminicola]|uniref:Glutathione synthetase n=1 Tax=Meloidogyne graminicola TaxID=189291 RepID=A0A8S9ZX74_9BILA|nr:Glutathione synthetase [Meloidogyne graminicola]